MFLLLTPQIYGFFSYYTTFSLFFITLHAHAQPEAVPKRDTDDDFGLAS
jgi:hypothetical protein